MKMKKEYFGQYKILREIINKADPMGLISQGAPEHEYDQEVSLILPKISKNKNNDEVANIIQDVFVNMFGEEAKINIAVYEEIARKWLKEVRDIK